MFRRIAIVNRGEPARRLIHAAHELGQERGEPIRTIAFHTAAERWAAFVREADEAIEIGGAGNPYLNHAELERALRASRADAAWVGWGFVAEDPAFAELCERIGVVFVGPTAEVMRRLGDKIEAKLLAEQLGVPVAPWSGGPVENMEEALRHAAVIGFPLMIKATAGGGGRGIRKVGSEAELATAFERARDEARRSFGDPTVLFERLVTGARHIEVQIIADHHGNAWALGVRDCSIQRRNQKLIEESASPALDPEQARELGRSAVRLVTAVGYRNAGTVEFLYEPIERTFSFLEVNTRLQVEHPVTEATSGTDLVKLQLLVASGQALEGEPPVERGHAIEARLNAEDPEREFAPAPGRLDRLRFPSGPGIRVDTGFTEGDVIPSEYDSMISKIVAWGSNRAEARARLCRALAEMSVVVAGGATNRTFLLHLLNRPEVVAGTADTGWIDRVGASEILPQQSGEVALLAVAIDAHDAEETVERERFFAAARRGRPATRNEMERTIELRHRGSGYRISVARVGVDRYRVRVDGTRLDVHVERVGPFERRLGVAGEIHRVVLAVSPPDQLVEVDRVAHRVSLDEGGLIRAPAPALVVAIAVAAGDEVEQGTPVVVLESMKMETTITAPFAGHVREVLVAGNVQVAAGAPLVRLEARTAAHAAEPDRPRVSFAAASGDATADPEQILADLRSLVMGYDIDADEVRDLVGRLKDSPPDDPVQVHKELGILTVFADLAELSRDRPPVEDLPDAEDLVHSPREHFNAFLRSLDAEREGVPDPLRRSLARALAHYGVGDLKQSAELAEACYRIFLAHRRASSQLPAVAALLDRRLHGADSLPESHRDELSRTLDRLIVATQLRHPAIGDLARRVRFACFDQPAVVAAWEGAHAAVREQLDILAANPAAPDYEERIEAVVAEPHPLIRLLGERLATGIGPHEPLLEVLTRRYYKIRELQDLKRVDVDGRQFVTATYGRRADRRVRVVTTLADASGIAAAATGIGELIGDVPEGESAVADIYVAWPDAPTDLDALSDRLATDLAAAALPAGVRRVAVSVSDPNAGVARYFTFRRVDGGLVEESVVRGLHPMIARRLRFWRLENFDIERLPSVEDTYLFGCSAPGGAERLVALAEVRDLEPTRDGSGALVALPEIERILSNCLESIRVSQAAAPRGRRLDANHVFLYVWPTVDVPLRDLVSVARSRLAQMTAGLGLEEAVLHFRTRNPDLGEVGEMALTFSYQPGAGATVSLADAPDTPLATLDSYDQRKLPARRRGTVYPYELVPLIAGAAGSFVEHDLDGDGNLVPVDRPPGLNEAGIVCGVVRTPTAKYPEGICRVVLMGDPTKSLGSVAEPECRRVMAAIELAGRLGVPVEWFALSSGAKISRDSGVENMEWVARALRLIVEFTQSGGEINVIVAGINVGAQPYWNAEATMLMHTRGILVMTPDSAMVLTGKHALDYSGGVSAEDNFGIGGFDRVMGPNGQAQYWAPHLAGACELLFAYYDHAYVAPGERFPRRAETSDPPDRDVRAWTLERVDGEFATVGEIFSADANPERKRPFDIRPVIRAVVDQDHEPLERWSQMADAETAVVCDAHLGGHPVTVIGIESRPMPRTGSLPADGPDQWTAGTLFPLSSKKVARGINAASGNRPVVVLANLSGFDGSPESLRKWQLEYGAEIGRAVVNFDGPIVFCVISRYHGGAFVVFSGALNDNMEVIALEGSYASVIGGAPAAAVVFARDVDALTTEDPRVADIQRRLAEAGGDGHASLLVELERTRAAVRSEKLGEVAADFDSVHSIERAREVGSVHAIIPASNMRRYLIEAIERGMARSTAGTRGVDSGAQTTGGDSPA
jgi:acetyl/propionyl-CoA carboxylase alpha subunit/acetyl-CoA carboxylase carboxyltransferase component